MQKESFRFVQNGASAFRKVFYKWKRFQFAEKAAFSAYAKPPNIRKAFSQRSKTSTSHRTQTNVQPQILSEKPYCKLAESPLFFETPQSCVSSTASLSHRFKSSPAIPGKVALSGATGYMMMAGHFCQNHVSSGDLNRPRSPEVRKPLGYFWFFSYKRKE